MSVSPRDLLAAARHAAEDCAEESTRRKAASQAYYAAFHAAKRFHVQLPRPGRSKVGAGEHENLIHCLRNPDPALSDDLRRESTLIGDLLLRIRPIRVKADYHLDASFCKSEMHDCIEQAAHLINRVIPKTR